MHLQITSDANEESGVGSVIDEMSGPTKKHFISKEYGKGLDGIVIVLMCRNPDLDFKQRIRFSKKEKMLYMDLMLDLAQMIQITDKERNQAVIDIIAAQAPEVIQKYSIPDFDAIRFVEDLRSWLKEVRE